jgi:hypothetical protein
VYLLLRPGELGGDVVDPELDDDRPAAARHRRRRAGRRRLDWLPAVLAGLGLPFAVREPAELREAVRAWAARLTGCATATGEPQALEAWGLS